MATILIVDDHDSVREGLKDVIEKMGHRAEVAASGDAAVALFQRQSIDFVLSDLRMAGGDGMSVLKSVHALEPDCPVVIMTAYGAVDAAVEAMKLGALDFVLKPFSPDLVRLKVGVGLALRAAKRTATALRAENSYLRQELTGNSETFVGNSDSMKKIFASIARVANTEASVAIYGESGTGKELVAQAIHEQSTRANGPFIKVNCGALAENLLESELFGHEQGAFTGAIKKKLGRFELADRGTLFLDEIGDIPASLQTKLLRVIQEQQFERVGGEKTISVDVRLLCATHRDLGALVESGQFREDLYYRLHVIPLFLPALRDRADDIGALCQHFIRTLAPKLNPAVSGIDERALAVMQNHAWPGNVRELKNAIEQALVFSDGPEITEAALPDSVRKSKTAVAAVPPSPLVLRTDAPLPSQLEAYERAMILQAYEATGRVKTETARVLGIKTSALYYKLDKYGIE